MKKKADFPLLITYNDLIYLDNAATTQKPLSVINAVTDFYTTSNAPVKRGIYQLAEKATEAYEAARAIVARYLNADPNEVIFTSGATEGINFIAAAWAAEQLQEGDEIVLTELEHHANILPWQFLAQKKGITLRYIPVDVDGRLDYSTLDTLITSKTKLISCVTVSNAIGTTVDTKRIIMQARKVGARVLLDACQSAPHAPLDVQELDCDFLVFSGHKILGPTGIGVLFIKHDVQPYVRPYKFGGGMVLQADYFDATYLDPPHCFEAGMPPIAQAVGLGAALEYLTNQVDFNALQNYEAQLCAALIDGLQSMHYIRILGPIDQLEQQGHLVSFVHEKYHYHDVGAFLDKHSIAVRTGHYCAQPLARKLGIDGSIRVSFYLYNDEYDIKHLLEVLKKLT